MLAGCKFILCFLKANETWRLVKTVIFPVRFFFKKSYSWAWNFLVVDFLFQLDYLPPLHWCCSSSFDGLHSKWWNHMLWCRYADRPHCYWTEYFANKSPFKGYVCKLYCRTQVACTTWGLHAKRRWCLSGTPIQNSVDDLVSYFRLLRYFPWDAYKKFCFNIKDPISRTPAESYCRL